MNTYQIKRITFTFAGKDYVAIHFTNLVNDRVELYRVDRNGLEIFEGYTDELAQLLALAESARN